MGAVIVALLVRLLGVGLLFFLGFLVERRWPADRQKSTSRRLNTVHAVIFEAVDVSLGAYIAVAVASLIAKLPFTGMIPLGADRGHFWIAIPLTLFGVIVADFFYYWFHRLQHASPWLWAVHEVHHSDESVNMTTALRHHWLERPLYSVFITLPMSIIFKPPMLTVATAVILSNLPGYFVHMNARIRFGWLNYLFASPQSHRVHHSKLPQHIDKNFAVTFALWDIIFGTYYHPSEDEWPSTGLASGKRVLSVTEALVLPFISWRGMIAERLHKAP
jgi:sterol desaturase/sphingolipid hydroxylase (fatty acid hydroxylase superfamily)